MSNHKDDSNATNSMEQVRELLFGTRLKEMEITLKRQEERFQREISDLNEALKSRFESLENFMRSETTSLSNKLNVEVKEITNSFKDKETERRTDIEATRKEQKDSLERLTAELSSAQEVFDRKVIKLSNSLDNVEQELKKLMLSETNSSNTKIEERYKDTLKVISETAEQLRNDMVCRSSLSGLLAEIAAKLSGVWNAEMLISGETGKNAKKESKDA